MNELVNLKTNELELVPDSEVRSRIMSGEYGFRDDQPVTFRDDIGEKVQLKPQDAVSALADPMARFRFYGSEEKTEDDLQAKYGDVGGIAATALQEFSSGLSFGLTDPLFGTEEEVEARKRINPFTATVSELTGMIAPAVISGGSTGTLSTIAKATPAGIAETLGRVANTQTKEIISKYLGKKSVSNIGGWMADGIAQAGMYDALDYVSEVNLGDKDFNAETLLARTANGMVYGAAGGLILGGGMEVAAKAFNKATKAVMKEFKQVAGYEGGEDFVPRYGQMKRKTGNLIGNRDEFISLRQAPDDPNILIYEDAKNQITVDKSAFGDAIHKFVDLDNPKSVNSFGERFLIFNLDEHLPKDGNLLDAYLSAAKAQGKFPTQQGIKNFKSQFDNIYGFKKGENFYVTKPQILSDKMILGRSKKRLIPKDQALTMSDKAAFKMLDVKLPELKNKTAKKKKHLANFIRRKLSETNQYGYPKYSELDEWINVVQKTIDDMESRKDRILTEGINLLKDMNVATDITSKDAAEFVLKTNLDNFLTPEGRRLYQEKGFVGDITKYINPNYSDDFKALIEFYNDVTNYGKVQVTNIDGSKRNVWEKIDLETINDFRKKSGKTAQFDKKNPSVKSLFYQDLWKYSKEEIAKILSKVDNGKGLANEFNRANYEQSLAITTMGWMEKLANKHLAHDPIGLLGNIRRAAGATNAGFLGGALGLPFGAASAAVGYVSGTAYEKFLKSKWPQFKMIYADHIIKEAERYTDRIRSTAKGFVNVGKNAKLDIPTKFILSTATFDYTKEFRRLFDRDDLQESSAFIESNPILYDFLPQAANSYEIKGMKMKNFLRSKFPKPLTEWPELRDYTPPESSVEKYKKYKKYSLDVTTVLDEIKSGYVSPEGAEVLKELYPSTLQAVQEEIFDEMSKGKKLGNYQKIMIKRLLGIDISPITQFKNIVSVQQTARQAKESEKQAQSMAGRSRKHDVKIAQRQGTIWDQRNFERTS